MPILKSLFSNEGAFFMHQNVAFSLPSAAAERGSKGEDVFSSLSKACLDCEYDWSRDPGRSGFILINSYFFTFLASLLFFSSKKSNKKRSSLAIRFTSTDCDYHNA